MTSGNRLSRLLALVPWLSAHPGITMPQAAQHFGITVGQLESDLNLLVCNGLPGHRTEDLVDIQFWDEGGHIDVLDPQTLGRPLRLSPEEAMALLVALRLLAQVPGDHDRDALASVTATLEEAAGSAARGADRLQVDLEVPGDIAETVESALRARRVLRLSYLSGVGEASERDVDPIRTLALDGHAYLEAWCHRAGAIRTFRLDRIVSATVLNEPATPPPDGTGIDLPAGSGIAARQASVSNPLHPQGPPATLLLRPEASWLLDEVATDSVEQQPDGSWLVVVPVPNPTWAVRWALRLGGAARVLGPPELVEAVRTAASRALAAYEAPTLNAAAGSSGG